MGEALERLVRRGLPEQPGVQAGHGGRRRRRDGRDHVRRATSGPSRSTARSARRLACPGTQGAGPGGYTYGDFGKIVGFPEVHADGEIWLETLWQIRQALGPATAETLVTRAMELSPPSAVVTWTCGTPSSRPTW